MRKAILRAPLYSLKRFICVSSILLVFCFMMEIFHSSSASAEIPKISVVVSANIKPYAAALEGLTFDIGNWAELDVFFLNKLKLQERERLLGDFTKKQYAAVIAVGTEAAREVVRTLPETGIKIFHLMALNPSAFIPESLRPCGISLNIPEHRQLKFISVSMPSLKRIGLLFDPKVNKQFFEEALAASKELKMEVVPIMAVSKTNLPEALADGWDKIDALWLIPDSTLISERVIEFVIKEAALRGKPVIGYNRFFYDNGAAAAFVFDYRDLGRQMADLAKKVIAGGSCVQTEPSYKFILNEKVLKRLAVEFFPSDGMGVEVWE